VVAAGSAEPEVQRALVAPTQALSRFSNASAARFSATPERVIERRYGFRIGPLNLLLAAGLRSEMVQATRLAPIPGTVAAVLGFINLRGAVLPVFDLRRALGLPKSEGAAPTATLVLDRGPAAAAVQIDGVPFAVQGLAAEQPASLNNLPALLRACITGAYDSAGAVWYEFDHRSLFSRVAAA
jgi:chemotaxis signal transduction protein